MSATTVLASAAVCRPGPLAPGWVAFDDGRLVEVNDGSTPRPTVDLGDAVLAPGFIDLQVNGVDDIDFARADQPQWHRAGSTLARRGVTGYLATFVSAPLGTYDAPLTLLEATRAAAVAGASVPLGAHLEGPFLGAAPGAHPVELLRPADLGWLETILGAYPGLIRMVTLAPEADPGFAATRLLAGQGIVVALGHSRASDEEARAAAAAGARVVTHVFNGMGPLHHRAPGLVGAALDDERLTPTLIADLVHVDAVVVRIVFAATASVALVSDAVATGNERPVEGGAARLADGRLAGATALLDRAVANVTAIGVPIERAVAAVTTVPAELLGVTDRGRLEVGARADVVALDPHAGTLRGVWVAGERVA